jgi:hypothetical protein
MSIFAEGVKELAIKRGIPCIPVPPKEKGTRLVDWPNLATTDLVQLRAWNKENPEYNIGAVATNDGVYILDDDDGLLKERYQADTGNPFPKALLVVKSSKGFHYYYPQTEKSRATGNIKKKGAFDLQQNKKYVVGPYSVHPSGAIYTPVESNEVAEDTDALLDWLIAGLKNPVTIGGEEAGVVTAAQKAAFEKYLGPEAHDENITEVGYDNVNKRWAYARNLGCPFREVHTNPNTCALDREFYVYISPTGPQVKCVHSSCEMTWKKYRDFLVEKSGHNYPMDAGNDYEVVVGHYDAAEAKFQADMAAMKAIPDFPEACLDGSLIGDMARALTCHTFIPPVFAYNNIKVALGLLIDGCVGFPHHPALHMRSYSIQVSTRPGCGKGESRARAYDINSNGEAGILRPLMKDVLLDDGNVFGSGQKMKMWLADNSGRRILLSFDELRELFLKTKQGNGNTLESTLLQLHEKTEVGQSTVGVGDHLGKNIRLSFSGDMTTEGFREAFEGTNSIGNGFLSRCVIGLSDRMKYAADWEEPNTLFLETLRAQMGAAIDGIVAQSNELQHVFIPEETPAAKSLRNDFLTKTVNDEELEPFIDRVDAHFKRDLLLRVIFSNTGSNIITEEQMRRSISWAEYQLLVRKKLWQAEGSDKVALMNKRIIAALTRHQGRSTGLSEAELGDFCHTHRDGSQEVFARAIRALRYGASDIEVFGVNRKGFKLYRLRAR